MTSLLRSTTVVGVVSDTESNALITPPFWLTNARPSAANRTDVGLSRPDQIVYSRKRGSANVPAALASWVGPTDAGGPATRYDAARTSANTTRVPARAAFPLAASILVPACPYMDGEGYPRHARIAMGSAT